MTPGYGWERGREAGQAVSLLGVWRPEAIPQSEDYNLTVLPGIIWVCKGVEFFLLIVAAGEPACSSLLCSCCIHLAAALSVSITSYLWRGLRGRRCPLSTRL